MTLSLQNYYDEIKSLLADDDVFELLESVKQKFVEMNKAGGKLLLVGNGGSAGIVAHAAVDFTKQAGVTALTFNEPALITAFSRTVAPVSGGISKSSMSPIPSKFIPLNRLENSANLWGFWVAIYSGFIRMFSEYLVRLMLSPAT